MTSVEIATKEADRIGVAGKRRRILINYLRAYLDGEYEFFGSPSKAHHRALLIANGVNPTLLD